MSARTDDDKPTPAAQTDEVRAGDRIAGRFVLEERLAAGAHGVVWRARQEPLGRAVALKLLRADADDPHAAERLLREGRALAALRHENVVAVYDAGETERGAPFVVMELVSGPSLRAVLDGGPVPAAHAIAVARGVARALDAAHAAGVIHRDLKPENILLATAPPTGAAWDARDVRVVDFGLARHHGAAHDANLSTSAVIRGTPATMSPEQAQGGAADARSDLYALGVVLYELLTGANPFLAETPLKTLLRHAEGPRPPAPSTFVPCPAALDALIARLLAVDPHARPASALAVVEALDALEEPSAREPRARAPDAAAPAIEPASPTTTPSTGARVAGALVLASVLFGAWMGLRAGARSDSAADAGATLAADAGEPSTDASVPSPADAGARPAHSDQALDAGPTDAAPHAASGPDAGVAAGVAAGVGARTTATRPRADAGVTAPVEPTRPRTLVEKVEHLRARCRHAPCTNAALDAYARTVGGDLDALKRARADVDACIVVCATAGGAPHGQ